MYILYNKRAGVLYQFVFLYGFKNKPFRKFIDVKILKIDLVWAIKSRKKFIENGTCVFITYKDTH